MVHFHVWFYAVDAWRIHRRRIRWRIYNSFRHSFVFYNVAEYMTFYLWKISVNYQIIKYGIRPWLQLGRLCTIVNLWQSWNIGIFSELFLSNGSNVMKLNELHYHEIVTRFLSLLGNFERIGLERVVALFEKRTQIF